MRNKIIQKLKYIEVKDEVKILYAIESGSRGWGFESKDSDYDIRFIYVHPLDWYLSIEEKRDVIEYPISDSLDISGWDIKKALKLFKSSNPPLYEWLNSPIVYIEKGDFAKKLRESSIKFYSPTSSIYHYLNMAKGNYKAYLAKSKVKIKKYFYALRPVLACMWVEKHKTLPPMEFEKLLNAQNLELPLIKEVSSLLKRKRSGEELDVKNKIEIIDKFLKDKISYFEDYIKSLPVKRSSRKTSLDLLLREIVKAYL